MSSAAVAVSYEPHRSNVRLIEPPMPDVDPEPTTPPALSMDRVVSSLQLILAARRAARFARPV
jgi:hypothetical protein